jgi:nitroimidazol reductase NimA-like FMN-containing flavoprotein (pyridoxamine 5'-phosphate oxidase superfamily)
MTVHELSIEQCRDMLARSNIGRLGCARADQSYIVPVSFTFDRADDSIDSFSTLGQKVDWMRGNSKVCLEVDDIINQFNWMTVVVFGRYQEIGQSAEQSDVRRRVYELLQQRRSWWLPGAAKTAPETEHNVPIIYRVRIEQMAGRHTFRPSGDTRFISPRS